MGGMEHAVHGAFGKEGRKQWWPKCLGRDQGRCLSFQKQNIETEKRDVGLSRKLKVSGCEVSKEETKPWRAAAPRSAV